MMVDIHHRFHLESTPRFSVISHTDSQDKVRIWIDVPCAYTRQLLLTGLSRRSSELIQTTNDKHADILWADYEDLDWDRILEGQVKANSYLVRKGLSRKAQLAYHLHKYLCKRPISCLKKAFPETLVIETWEAFEDEMTFGTLGASFDRGLMPALSQQDRLEWCLRDSKERLSLPENQGKLWILKPSVTNKGAEIHVIDDFKTAQRVIQEWPDVREWVLQSYIAHPLLFHQRKFHLRCYVLAVGDLSVYVWKRILLLSSAVEYDADDISNQLAHITNTARQAEGNGFVEQDCVHLLEDLVDDLMHPMGDQKEGISQQEAQNAVTEILNGIQEVTGELFRALHGERTVFAPQPNCFELLGLDFLVSYFPATPSSKTTTDVKAPSSPIQVHLLEVNPGPDFKQTGPRLEGVIEGLLEATLDMAVLEKKEVNKDMVLVYEDHDSGAGLYAAGKNGGERKAMRLLDG